MRVRLVTLVEQSLTLAWAGTGLAWDDGCLWLGGASVVGVTSGERVVLEEDAEEIRQAKRSVRGSSRKRVALYVWLAVCKYSSPGQAALAM